MTRSLLKQSTLATLTAGLLLASSAGYAGAGKGVTFNLGDVEKSANLGPVKPGPVIRFPFNPLFLGGYVVVLQPVGCIWNCRGPRPTYRRLLQ